MADATVAFQGWNASGVGWGEQGWGEGLSNLTATGAVGDVTVVAKACIDVTGVEGSGAVGDVSVVAKAVVSVTGVQGTTALNTVTVTGTGFVYPTGVTGTGQVGTVHTQSAYSVTGVYGTGRIGKVLIWETITNDQNPNWVQIIN